MLKSIIVKFAIIVMSLLIVTPVTAEEKKTIKEDKIVVSPLCIFWGCPPIEPIEPGIPGMLG